MRHGAVGWSADRTALRSVERMSLFKYIIQGIGHTLGSEATRGALKKVAHLAEESEAEETAKAKAKVHAEKEEAASAKKRAKEDAAKKKRDEADIERELAALKKKIGKGIR